MEPSPQCVLKNPAPPSPENIYMSGLCPSPTVHFLVAANQSNWSACLFKFHIAGGFPCHLGHTSTLVVANVSNIHNLFWLVKTNMWWTCEDKTDTPTNYSLFTHAGLCYFKNFHPKYVKEIVFLRLKIINKIFLLYNRHSMSQNTKNIEEND